MAAKSEAAVVEPEVQEPVTPAAPEASTTAPEATAPEVPAVQDPVEVVPAEPAATSTDLTHVVLRPFVGAGIERFIGEVVDASTWRMADVLVEGRRLRTFDRKDPEPVTDGQGRFFIDDDTLLAYIDSIVPTAPQEG